MHQLNNTVSSETSAYVGSSGANEQNVTYTYNWQTWHEAELRLEQACSDRRSKALLGLLRSRPVVRMLLQKN